MEDQIFEQPNQHEMNNQTFLEQIILFRFDHLCTNREFYHRLFLCNWNRPEVRRFKKQQELTSSRVQTNDEMIHKPLVVKKCSWVCNFFPKVGKVCDFTHPCFILNVSQFNIPSMSPVHKSSRLSFSILDVHKSLFQFLVDTSVRVDMVIHYS